MPEVIELSHAQAMELTNGNACYGFGAKPDPIYANAIYSDLRKFNGGDISLVTIQRQSDKKYFATEYTMWDDYENSETSPFGAEDGEYGYDENFIVTFYEAREISGEVDEYDEPTAFELVK